MKKPLVSVIMGVYNGENTLGKCIESILNQTYNNWEFIICDDCSTDLTMDILNYYSSRDSRIIILRNEKNSKLAITLNNCLQIAKGEYIARMDSDDISLPNRLETQVEFLNSNIDVDVVGTSAKIFNEYSTDVIRKPKIGRIYKEDLIYGTPHIHPSIMMRKYAYDILNGYRPNKYTSRSQDWDLWFRFYSKNFIGFNIDEPLLLYHETKEDYKKRTIKSAIGSMIIAYNGFKLLNISKIKYIMIFKPLISYFLPEKLKQIYRKEF